MKLKEKSAIITVAIVLCIGNLAVAGWYNYPIWHYPQERINTCGVTTAQMWIGYLTGVAPSQDLIIKDPRTPNVGRKINSGQGLGADDMVNILATWTGKDFDYHNHYSQSEAEQRIKKEFKDQHNPLAFAGTTNMWGAKPKPLGHWMIITAADVNSKGQVSGVFINDPLYNSRFAKSFDVVVPGTYVRDLFSKWWKARASDGLRQSVED